MSALERDDFAAVFEAVHGYKPFLWQDRLLTDVLEQGWPRTIAAPTGAGKTAVIDIALFHLALEAAKEGGREAPMRIVFAVDRRVIVDQAFERAEVLRQALAAPQCSAVQKLRDALASYGGGMPLHAEELRGGMPREDDWARAPNQPTVLCTTVDQLGSRLFFRGYGVSPGMAPVHAGLLGEDTLLLLDEAHLSRPFEETLQWVERLRAGEAKPTAPWAFSALTATPRSADTLFELTAEERAESAIATQLQGPAPDKSFKPTRLVSEACTMGSPEHVRALAGHAHDLAKAIKTAAPTVAVIVNRVGLARGVCDALRASTGADTDVILLTGRVRPYDRDRLIERYEDRLRGARPSDTDTPLFVVATQTIEAGADFDFDALLTQIAPLDALRQRFGRLDRGGKKGGCPAMVVAAKDEIAARADDPLYGPHAKAAWQWLLANAVPGARKSDPPIVDFGPDAMDKLIAEEPEACAGALSPSRSAPILRRADAEFFSVTSPRPHPDPALPLFLHGDLRIEGDVSIVWRGDFPRAPDAMGTRGWRDFEGGLKEIVALVPPRPAEGLAIPFWQARQWLWRRKPGPTDPLADVPGASAETSEGSGRGRWALRWRGADDPETGLIHPSDLRPGDTIVVPAWYGGSDAFGWAPLDEEPVPDIAEDVAAHYETRRAALRLHRALWQAASFEPVLPWAAVSTLVQREAENGPGVLLEELQAKLGDSVSDSGELPSSPNALRSRIEAFRNRGVGLRLEPYDRVLSDWAQGAIIVAPRGLEPEKSDKGLSTDDGAEAVTDGDDAGSFRQRELSLETHRKDVAEKAEFFANRLRLDPVLTESLIVAARFHDDGKADPRFQSYLAGGGVPPADPLAKSGRPRSGSDRGARTRSGLPARWRHEALSVRLAVARLENDPPAEADPDLILWLVGTHHGYGRPFFPHEDRWDDETRSVFGVDLPAGPGPHRLEFVWNGMDWAELFQTLKVRYGIWGLAYLEAVLRLADHRASEEADRRGEKP